MKNTLGSFLRKVMRGSVLDHCISKCELFQGIKLNRVDPKPVRFVLANLFFDQIVSDLYIFTILQVLVWLLVSRKHLESDYLKKKKKIKQA